MELTMNTADTKAHNLKIKALFGFVELIAMIGLFLFAPAGSFNFCRRGFIQLYLLGHQLRLLFIYGEQTLNFWLAGSILDQPLKGKGSEVYTIF